MRFVSLWIVRVVLVVACSVDSSSGGWESDFSEANKKAQRLSVPLVVHFYADWCGPCQQMERGVLNTQEVSSLLGHGILGVKVNSDRRRDIVSSFGITSLPADVVISPNGTITHRSSGARTLVAYRELLQTNIQTKTRGSYSKQASGVDVRNTATVSTSDSMSHASSSGESSVTKGARIRLTSGGSGKQENGKTASRPSSVSVVGPAALQMKNGIRVGIHGFCPVSLCQDTKWQKGEAEFQQHFEGVHYRFASQEALEKFQLEPQRFAPILHGCDPVVMLEENSVRTGRINYGARYRERIYFFVSKANMEAFQRTPEKFARDIRVTFFEDRSADVAADQQS